MAAPRKTVTELLLGLRTNLDEREASFWTDVELIGYLDQAQAMVWSRVKALKSDYFDVQRSSTDGSVTILGEAYSTSGFAIAASTTSYTLPPDMDELKLIECITSGYEATRFTFADMTSWAFRSLLAVTDAQEPSGFLCDLIGERTLVVVPKANRALDLKLTYTPILGTLTATTDTLQVPQPLWLAVVDFATARAMKKDRDASFLMWEQAAEKHLATFFGSHARQTQDSDVVESFFC
jgi:hypothetical protein